MRFVTTNSVDISVARSKVRHTWKTSYPRESPAVPHVSSSLEFSDAGGSGLAGLGKRHRRVLRQSRRGMTRV